LLYQLFEFDVVFELKLCEYNKVLRKFQRMAREFFRNLIKYWKFQQILAFGLVFSKNVLSHL
jgi:hypothetical protein